MGYKDLQSVKEFITKKSYVNNTLNLEEELFLDTLNKKVDTSLTSQIWFDYLTRFLFNAELLSLQSRLQIEAAC